jgi:ubiquinone/menaquinone biosynthesis C-methylase UbiE
VSSRRFAWISSATGDAATLARLDERMARYYECRQDHFYSDWHDRTAQAATKADDAESLGAALARYVRELTPGAVLEVGCGDGAQYEQLSRGGFDGRFTGVDLSVSVIERNRRRFPAANWQTGSVYALPFERDQFDVCYCSFVLEHLVYPERGLQELLRALRPGGKLVLVFPDFVAKRQLNSQALGISPSERLKEKLRRGRLLDAALTLYDSRLRLPRALRRIPRTVGRFPINTAPICLSYDDVLRVDIDAVYIASKREVGEWAVARGHGVEFPFGTRGEFSDIAFMTITK